MRTSAGTRSSHVIDLTGGLEGCRGPLFRAFARAAREGVSRHAFAAHAGLTCAEVMMLERACGVCLAD